MGSPTHETDILNCNRNLYVTQADKVSEWELQNGLFAEGYDRNSDGLADIVTFSHTRGPTSSGDEPQVEHDPHPLFYIVDIDFDQLMDAVYIDVGGLGKCDEIILYEDLTIPHGPQFKMTPEMRGARESVIGVFE